VHHPRHGGDVEQAPEEARRTAGRRRSGAGSIPPKSVSARRAAQGRAVFLDENDTLGKAFSFVTPLSIPFLLDGLVPQLSAAVDGDSTTAAA